MGNTTTKGDKAKSSFPPLKARERGFRLDPETFELPVEKMREGYYSDKYFNRAKEILEKDNYHPVVLMQVFQKHNSLLCGIDEAIAILKFCSGYYDKSGKWIDGWDKLEVKALYDGDLIKPFDVVMTIAGDYSLFAHLETDYLGVLARRTKIATNTKAVVNAANGKPILFFPARFDHHLMQTGDGYAAYITGTLGVSTDAQAQWWGSKGLGTIPHSLIAAYNGDTVKATEKFAEYMDPEVSVIALVDFQNDSVTTSLKCAQALGKKLWGVRLDTSATMVDKSLWEDMSVFPPTGVNPKLVRKVRKALDEAGYNWVKIVVSGGFNPDKIKLFEKLNIPADVYAVGSWLLKGSYDFTADVVMIKEDDKWKSCAKVGRKYNPNPDLVIVE
ncbi:MAG: quinolinate phosphoribosyl transferase [Candidatus Eremiobacteraeota bacterium]|nr:quinolinate phosphoribosyl transferase [Candidatus Eremiobacteraeota bacterium]